MRDKFNLFGSSPDTIKDDWIDNIETLDENMDQYIDAQKCDTGFDLRYNAHLSLPIRVGGIVLMSCRNVILVL